MFSSFDFLHKLIVSCSSFLTIRKVTLDNSVDFVWPQLRLTDSGHKDIGKFFHTLFRKEWIHLLDITHMKQFHSVDCLLTVLFHWKNPFLSGICILSLNQHFFWWDMARGHQTVTCKKWKKLLILLSVPFFFPIWKFNDIIWKLLLCQFFEHFIFKSLSKGAIYGALKKRRPAVALSDSFLLYYHCVGIFKYGQAFIVNYCNRIIIKRGNLAIFCILCLGVYKNSTLAFLLDNWWYVV